MGKVLGKYLMYGLLGVNIALLFLNFIASFIFALFLIMMLLSAGGYGSPEGKWQAYTTGTGNWRIGGVAARGEDYTRTLEAEKVEKKGIRSGNTIPLILGLIIVVSLLGMALNHGSIIDFFMR
uniref:Uncharacterized protein n=1 Tax=uncultured euryarchaeote Alv-FOS1 TaxID=337892 RepID=Q3SAC1_9EURY|nr:hypothetical protein [uncultured euryarchaeote Alv-FOS1]